MISVRELLKAGRERGLTTVCEAWDYALANRDVFFISDDFARELSLLKVEMYEKGLLELNNGYLMPGAVNRFRWSDECKTIEDALRRIDAGM